MTTTRYQLGARGDLARLPTGLSRQDQETVRMDIIANRRAEAANPRWVDGVRFRKLCIVLRPMEGSAA